MGDNQRLDSDPNTTSANQRPRIADTRTLEQRAMPPGRGADLVFEGGGVKGIGLAGAVSTLDQAGYVFPRVGGTSAGAIVAALVAAYQVAGVPLSTLEDDMQALDYRKFKAVGTFQRHLGLAGNLTALLEHQGIYSSEYLPQWLSSKLRPLGISTFGDLKITSDSGTDLPLPERYRLVVHTSDLSRHCLVRLPWDLPQYLFADPSVVPMDQQIAAIDRYSVIDAVRASMSIPFYFRPFVQRTARGECTWVDGGMLQNFPVTVFDRTDGQPPRWPTFGIKLSSEPKPGKDEAAHGDLSEALAIAHTALGEWNRYQLADDGVNARTIWVDTKHVSATDFGISPATQQELFASGQRAAGDFLAAWNRAETAPA